MREHCEAQHCEAELFSWSSRAQVDKAQRGEKVPVLLGSSRALDWKQFSSSVQPLQGPHTLSGQCRPFPRGSTGSRWLVDLTGLHISSLHPRTAREASIFLWCGSLLLTECQREWILCPLFPLEMSGKVEALMYFPGSTSRLTWVYPEREFKWSEPHAQAVVFPESSALCSYALLK